MARVRFPDDAFLLCSFVQERVPTEAAPPSVSCIQHLTVAQLVERGTVNYTAVIPRSMVRIRPVRLTLAEWPSGLRRWFKAPVSSEARVRISLQSLFVPGGVRNWIAIIGTHANRVIPMQRKRSGAAEARWAHNPKVGGSKPPFATFWLITCDALAEWLRRSPAK